MKLAEAPFGRLKITGKVSPLQNFPFLFLFREILKLQKRFLASNQTLYCQGKEVALTEDYTFFGKFMM